jgi:hypothetical protein
MEAELNPFNRNFRLADGADGIGVSCTLEGVALAGVPLLRKTVAGFAARPSAEIGVLIELAFGRDTDPAGVSRGLDVIAEALNRGDLGRAQVAAVRLALPELNLDGAIRIARADETLTKYDPSEPRDAAGRWTMGGGAGRAAPAAPRPRHVSAHQRRTGHGASTHHGPNAVQPPAGTQERVAAPQAGQDARLIHVGNDMSGASRGEILCLMASKQCQISALADKGRTPYFAACQKAEDVCLSILKSSRSDPERPFFILFPDKTVVSILDGNAAVPYIAGQKLIQPYK